MGEPHCRPVDDPKVPLFSCGDSGWIGRLSCRLDGSIEGDGASVKLPPPIGLTFSARSSSGCARSSLTSRCDTTITEPGLKLGESSLPFPPCGCRLSRTKSTNRGSA